MTGSATSSVVIDWEWFPHIGQRIFHYVLQDIAVNPVASFNLQGVCRAWRTEIKQRVFSHIVVTFKGQGTYYVTTLPKSIIFVECQPLVGGMGPTLRSLLSWARVLDINGRRFSESVIPKLAACATNVRMVRSYDADRIVIWSRMRGFRRAVAFVGLTGCVQVPSIGITPKTEIDSIQVWACHGADGSNGPLPLPCVPEYHCPAKVVMMYFIIPGKEREVMEEVKRNLPAVLRTLGNRGDITAVLDLAAHWDQSIVDYATLLGYNSFGATFNVVTHDKYRADVGEETYALHSMA